MVIFTAQKMNFSIKDYFSKCEQIGSFLQIWSHLLKKSLTEKAIFVQSVSCPVEIIESKYIYKKVNIYIKKRTLHLAFLVLIKTHPDVHLILHQWALDNSPHSLHSHVQQNKIRKILLFLTVY